MTSTIPEGSGQRLIGFDLETAKPFPEGEDWHGHRPLGITCAAIWQGEERNDVWYSKGKDGLPLDKMTREDLGSLVKRLVTLTSMGYQLVTWNGLGFDFDVLAEESGMANECVELANAHVDMMLHLFCVKGYPLALATAAEYVGMAGKYQGMSGTDAVRLWAEGEHEKVLKYVRQDARITAMLARASEDVGELGWISKAGRKQELRIPHGWLSVQESLAMPEPDTSWMTDPIPRSNFTRWLPQAVG